MFTEGLDITAIITSATGLVNIFLVNIFMSTPPIILKIIPCGGACGCSPFEGSVLRRTEFIPYFQNDWPRMKHGKKHG